MGDLMKKKDKKHFSRYTILILAMVIIFSAITSKLVYLQIVQHDYYEEKANNTVIEIPDPAPRGNITDANGNILAKNNLSYVLVYNETQENQKIFFDTMNKVFNMLNKYKETQQDDFALKVPDSQDKSFRFEFKSDNPAARKALEIRFKRDRGLNEEIEKKLFPDSYKSKKFTQEQTNKVNEELLKITPEETYNKLVKSYGLGNIKYLSVPKPSKNSSQSDNDKYNSAMIEYRQNQRKYMIIKDEIYMNTYRGYKSVVIANNIKKETAFIFLQMLSDLPGIDVTNQPLRVYPNGDLASNVLGYISKISSDEEKYTEKGYDVSSDYVGTAGIEAAFEDRLRGSKGGRIVRLNKYGRVVEELGRRESYPGQNIQLTINNNVQYAAEKALDETMKNLKQLGTDNEGVNTANATRGAAVVINVKTGGIIAMASRPGFDPNLFTTSGNLSTELLNKYFNPDYKKFGEEYVKSRGLQSNYPGKTVDQIVDILFPVDKSIKGNTTIRKDEHDIYPKSLYNYAANSLVPPGSTFKPMTAIAGLEEGVITPDTIIEDKGVFTKNNYGGACWIWTDYHTTHGFINVEKALEVSCNYFMYEVGDRLMYKNGGPVSGFDTLAKYAWKFGLGIDPKSKSKITTGIEIPENYGQVTNLESVKKTFSNIYMNKLISALKNNGNNSIDLNSSSGDSDEVKKDKADILSLINKQMKSNVNYNDFITKLSSEITSLVESSPALKAKNITSSDIDSIVQKINSIVSDAYGEISTPANIYNACIGQGTSVFTPLQLANYIATLVNGGTRYKLHLVDKITDADGNLIKKEQPEVMDKINLKASTVETVKQGMLKVTSGEEGTATNVFENFPIVTAGKTGSATYNVSQADYGRTSYAVYVGFAPYDNPEIAVCVIIFDGGHGTYAAPVARSIYEAYFKDEIKKLNPNYVPYYPDIMQKYFTASEADKKTQGSDKN